MRLSSAHAGSARALDIATAVLLLQVALAVRLRGPGEGGE